jgi:tyrosine-protein kinase Etk/Wzc
LKNILITAQSGGSVPSALGITDVALTSLIEQLTQLQLQRDKLLATTPETSPDFEGLNRQIATTRAAIKEDVGSIKASLLATKQQLESFNSGFESSIRAVPTQERQYNSIKRGQMSKENLYTYLLQKREEVSVSYAATIKNDRVVDPAFTGPLKSPLKSLIYPIAFMFGILVSGGFIYIRNSIRNRVVDLQDIKGAVKAPVLSEIYLDKAQTLINVNNTAVTILNEQFRLLRTKLHPLYTEKESGRITLITSSVAGEGKSFIASNLGIVLAAAERKTVILELDLRNPNLASVFNLPKANAGISEYLNGKATKANIIQSYSAIPNLDIISSGSKAFNAAELLEKDKLKNLIAELQKVYDDIIIDTPPAHLVPDALVVSRLADVSLYVIRQGVTEKTELEFLRELHTQQQLPNINIIFNGIDIVRYGYGYSYNNNYYNKQNKKPLISSLLSDLNNRF